MSVGSQLLRLNRLRLAAAATLGAALAMVGSAPRASAKSPDLSPYIGNTIACAAGIDGHDLCHTWLFKNGRMINFDQMGGHPGHYTLSPLRPDGTFSICYFYDSATIPIPAALAPPPFASRPGGPPPMKVVCTTTDFHSSCQRQPVPQGEPPQPMAAGMGQRFHAGLCYPMPAHMVPGTSWVANGDPLPSQGGKDIVLLIKGRR